MLRPLPPAVLRCIREQTIRLHHRELLWVEVRRRRIGHDLTTFTVRSIETNKCTRVLDPIINWIVELGSLYGLCSVTSAQAMLSVWIAWTATRGRMHWNHRATMSKCTGITATRGRMHWNHRTTRSKCTGITASRCRMHWNHCTTMSKCTGITAPRCRIPPNARCTRYPDAQICVTDGRTDANQPVLEAAPPLP